MVVVFWGFIGSGHVIYAIYLKCSDQIVITRIGKYYSIVSRYTHSLGISGNPKRSYKELSPLQK